MNTKTLFCLGVGFVCLLGMFSALSHSPPEPKHLPYKKITREIGLKTIINFQENEEVEQK